MARTVTGIDVGQRSALALRGSYKANTFHATGFAVASHAATDPRQAWAALEPGFKLQRSRVALSGRDLNVRYVRVPRVPDWQLRNLMRFEVAEIGDQSGSEVASDFNLLPELPEIEGEDVVLLCMARESLLEQHAQGLAAAGGVLDCFSPASLALYAAFLRYGVVQEDTVLVANIGHENIDLVIARGPDLVFARNLSGGSRMFDEAIAQRFGVDAAKAEELKRGLASLEPGAQHPTPNHEKASRAILGAAGQLLSLLQSSVLFAKSQVKIPSLKLDRVLICGGGAALEGLPRYLSAGMNVPVELFDPFRVVDVSALAPEEAELLEEYKLEAVVALGAATMASDPEAYSLEILPGAVAKRREFLGGTLWLIASAVLALAYLGYDAWSEKQRLDQSRTVAAGVAARLRAAQRIDRQTAELADENELLAGRALALQGTAGSGEQVARVLELLDRNLPGDLWLERVSSDWSWNDELGIGRGRERPILSLRGRARQGTTSPAVLWNELVARMRSELPAAALQPVLGATQESFTIDLSLFAPRPEADEADPEGAE